MVRAALAALGVERLVLGIHDPSFPAAPGQETGRGAPASRGALGFLRLASELGFDTVQLGPQGLTSRGNPSPYDAALFSREVLSIDLCALTTAEWGRLLTEGAVERLQASMPAGAESRVPHAWVFDRYRALLREAWEALRGSQRGSGNGLASSGEELWRRLRAFRKAHAVWLEADGLYEVLARSYGDEHWRRWPGGIDRQLWRDADTPRQETRRRELARRHRRELELFAFGQWLAHEQHAVLRREACALGLDLFGDLQVGPSLRDQWRYQELFLDGYLLGAPPSRTNPEGQPWGYPVLDPRHYLANGRVHMGSPEGDPLRGATFLGDRLERGFDQFDGLRIDHPQGLVCPWVYRADDLEPLAAVQRGARLLSSPDLPDHPSLAPWSIARPDQLARASPRWSDNWERHLEPEQVERHGVLIDLVLSMARRRGREQSHLAFEVLSTLPYPLARVLERHGVGRFRVTPKADLSRPDDPYRSENARPEDWVALGNHDTEPLAGVVAGWCADGQAAERAAYLASRLAPSGPGREALRRRLVDDPRRLSQALLADALASPARRVCVFFTDLLGSRERYNRPGSVGEANWSLRVPPGYRPAYARSVAEGEALDLARAAALALRARFGPGGGHCADLVSGLDELAVPWH
jgi:4-alpha-glucanotransferase